MHKEHGNLSVRLLTILGGALFCIIAVAYFFYGLQSVMMVGGQNNATSTVVKFQIAKGEGMREISRELSHKSLIRSIGVFKVYTLVSGKAQKFQPGIYDLSSAMSVPDIVRTLTAGGMNEVQVTIPEGATMKDVREILVEAGAWKKSVPFSFDMTKLRAEYPFLGASDSLEGFLFPDTYRIALDATPDEIVHVLLGNFRSKAWPLLVGRPDWHKTLTLASLLEREVPTMNDRQIVAGILMKRVRIRMPLQVDATLGYAKCNGLLRGCDARVTRADTALDSPYNTYTRPGWPPTPIANPGEDAIKAALTPQQTPYLYYLSTKSGTTLYSKTLDEHNDKRSRYL